jgi:hypothetical protein
VLDVLKIIKKLQHVFYGQQVIGFCQYAIQGYNPIRTSVIPKLLLLLCCVSLTLLLIKKVTQVIYTRAIVPVLTYKIVCCQ